MAYFSVLIKYVDRNINNALVLQYLSNEMLHLAMGRAETIADVTLHSTSSSS